MRAAFSRELALAAARDERILLLTGDHGYALFDEFRKHCPGQYINAGVAEQNMVGVAAGLAKAGFHPVVYGLSAFVPVRVLEQIKIDVCYEQLPVTFIGDGAGLVYSTLGTSHQSFEDIACLRAIPHLDILSPGDPAEMSGAMQFALGHEAPTYLRMGKADLGSIHVAAPVMRRGQLIPVRTGTHPVGFVATGSMLKTALALADEIDAAVWSAPWIKPLDEVGLAAMATGRSALVSFEEHSAAAGLGSALLEGLAESHPLPMLRIGIGERFSSTCGSHAHALREHGLDLEGVRARVIPFAARWRG
jgi:transketolase